MSPQEPVSPRASVLIVDESDECRDVLSTLLQRRGVSTFQARGARQGLDLMRQHCPDVVVLDIDSGAATDEGVCRQYDLQSRDGETALVILGIARPPAMRPRSGHIIAKPYHYAPLIRKIEELLQR